MFTFLYGLKAALKERKRLHDEALSELNDTLDELRKTIDRTNQSSLNVEEFMDKFSKDHNLEDNEKR